MGSLLGSSLVFCLNSVKRISVSLKNLLTNVIYDWHSVCRLSKEPNNIQMVVMNQIQFISRWCRISSRLIQRSTTGQLLRWHPLLNMSIQCNLQLNGSSINDLIKFYILLYIWYIYPNPAVALYTVSDV